MTTACISTSAVKSITIAAPEWETWGFRSALILILVSLVAANFIWQSTLAQRRERQLKAQVPEKTVKLREGVKVLDWLYSISGLTGQPDLFLQAVVQGTATLLPAAILVHIHERRRRVCISPKKQTKFYPP